MADIDVAFSCPKCGAANILVRVRERGASESLHDWLDQVVLPRVMAMHTLNNLQCDPDSLEMITPVVQSQAGTIDVGTTGTPMPGELTPQQSAAIRKIIKELNLEYPAGEELPS